MAVKETLPEIIKKFEELKNNRKYENKESKELNLKTIETSDDISEKSLFVEEKFAVDSEKVIKYEITKLKHKPLPPVPSSVPPKSVPIPPRSQKPPYNPHIINAQKPVIPPKGMHLIKKQTSSTITTTSTEKPSSIYIKFNKTTTTSTNKINLINNSTKTTSSSSSPEISIHYSNNNNKNKKNNNNNNNNNNKINNNDYNLSSRSPSSSSSTYLKMSGERKFQVKEMSEDDEKDDDDDDDEDEDEDEKDKEDYVIDKTTNSFSRSHHVAMEMLNTEESYVKRLRLIDEIYNAEIERTNLQEKYLPVGFHHSIFSNIRSIHHFHRDYVLPELQKCIYDWDVKVHVGKSLSNMAPFLKMYTHYATNFKTANDVIKSSVAKSERFEQLLRQLQNMPESGGLGLQHHLLEPIQRIPRYKLLLEEYRKHLPSDCEDAAYVEEAFKLVSQAASHSDEGVRKMEKFKELLEVVSGLVGNEAQSLITINRSLLRRGDINKVSARDGSIIKRHLILFNDILLVCKEVPVRMYTQYQVKSSLDLCGMKVYDGNIDDMCNFFVKSKQKSIEFSATTEEEKTNWIKAIWSAISNQIKLDKNNEEAYVVQTYSKDTLGLRAPTWVRDQEVSMCMLCCVSFNPIRRRHHCRACGKVVCHDCSTHKTKLEYDQGHLNRVCDECIKTLQPDNKKNNNNTSKPLSRLPTILRMRGASEKGVLNGYMQTSGMEGKGWIRRWMSLYSDGSMHFFKARLDIAATETLALPGYVVEWHESILKLHHQQLKTCCFFTTDRPKHLQKWYDMIKLATEAQLPLKPLSATSSFLSSPSPSLTLSPFTPTTPISPCFHSSTNQSSLETTFSSTPDTPTSSTSSIHPFVDST